MSILITGFEPFDGATRNPSWEAAALVPEEVAGQAVHKVQLPTVFGLASGYYIHNETEESISLDVSGAVFEFVDWNRQFTEPDADLFYETSSAAEFLEYCGTYEGGIPANTPFFLNINGNKLLKLKEIILA